MIDTSLANGRMFLFRCWTCLLQELLTLRRREVLFYLDHLKFRLFFVVGLLLSYVKTCLSILMKFKNKIIYNEIEQYNIQLLYFPIKITGLKRFTLWFQGLIEGVSWTCIEWGERAITSSSNTPEKLQIKNYIWTIFFKLPEEILFSHFCRVL